MSEFYVYLLASRTRVLYTGVTNNLERRIYEHKKKLTPGFTSKYRVDRLVYFESTSEVMAAIEREKEIKSWTRAKKIALIERTNPEWADLAQDWYERTSDSSKRPLPNAAPGVAASGDSSLRSE